MTDDEKKILSEVIKRVSNSVEEEEGRQRISQGIRKFVEDLLDKTVTKALIDNNHKHSTVRDTMNSKNVQEQLGLFEGTIKMLLDIATNNVEIENPEEKVISRFDLMDLE